MRWLLAPLAALAFAPTAAQAQDLPAVPRALLNTAALVCVRIDREGKVDAFLLDSKGDAARDKAVLDWVRGSNGRPAMGRAQPLVPDAGAVRRRSRAGDAAGLCPRIGPRLT